MLLKSFQSNPSYIVNTITLGNPNTHMHTMYRTPFDYFVNWLIYRDTLRRHQSQCSVLLDKRGRCSSLRCRVLLSVCISLHVWLFVYAAQTSGSSGLRLASHLTAPQVAKRQGIQQLKMEILDNANWLGHDLSNGLHKKFVCSSLPSDAFLFRFVMYLVSVRIPPCPLEHRSNWQ